MTGTPLPGDGGSDQARPATAQPSFLGRVAATPGATFLDRAAAGKPGARVGPLATRRQRSMADPVLLPCRVTLADGTTAGGAYPPAAHTRAFLRAIVTHQEHVAARLEIPRGPRIGGEVRVARGPRENSHAPADHAAILAHVERHARRGQELFCGVVPKTEPEPRKEAAAAGRVVWVDIDRKSTADPPTLKQIERLLDRDRGEVATDALVGAARLLSLPARPHLVAFSGIRWGAWVLAHRADARGGVDRARERAADPPPRRRRGLRVV